MFGLILMLRNVVPHRSTNISQTTLPQVSSTQWHTIMALLTGIMYMYIAIFCKKTMKYTWLPMIYHQTAYEIFEDIFTVQKLQCSKQWLWWRPGVNTENNSSSPFLQNEKGFYICFMRRSPNLITIYHIRIWMSNTNTSEIHSGVFF